ncbi:MAG: hypothetical protein ACE5IW_10735 [bacterium]
MRKLTIELSKADFERLEKAAKHAGKSIQNLICEWIVKLPEVEDSFDVTKDPIFQMEGYESDAPEDLSRNLDKYLYGEKYPR